MNRCWVVVATRKYPVRCFFVFASFFGSPRCRTSPHPSSVSEASPAGFFLPLAQTHLNLGKAIHFFKGKESKCPKTYFRTHSNILSCLNSSIRLEPAVATRRLPAFCWRELGYTNEWELGRAVRLYCFSRSSLFLVATYELVSVILPFCFCFEFVGAATSLPMSLCVILQADSHWSHPASPPPDFDADFPCSASSDPDQDVPLKRHRYPVFTPIVSFYCSERYGAQGGRLDRLEMHPLIWDNLFRVWGEFLCSFINRRELRRLRWPLQYGRCQMAVVK